MPLPYPAGLRPVRRGFFMNGPRVANRNEAVALLHHLMSIITSLTASKPHYEVLDGLRGVAATLIVVYHLCEACGIMFGHGYLAVDFFYALSGFVIAYAYDDRWKQMSVATFLKRRIIRLHPMVIMGTTLGLVFYYFGKSAAFPFIGTYPWWSVLLLYVYCCLMLPMPNCWDLRGWQDYNSFNGNIWSLTWEYVANLAYALGLRRLATRWLAVLVTLAGVMTLGLTLNVDPLGLLTGRVGTPFSVNGGWSLTGAELYVGLVRILFPFTVGMLLARLDWRLCIRNSFVRSSLLIVAVLLMPQLSGLANGIYEAVAILLLIPLIVSIGAGTQPGPSRSYALCHFLGEISYPLYITHMPYVYMLLAWKSNNPGASTGELVTMAVLLFLAAIATAYACLKLYDLPLRQWLKEKWH